MNYAILWDQILMTLDGSGRVLCETVETCEKAAEIIVNKFPRGQLSVAFESREMQVSVEENFPVTSFRSRTRDALVSDHPAIASIANGWGYEKPWTTGAMTHGLLYIEQGSFLSQLSDSLVPRKMDLIAAWPLHSLNMEWLRTAYGKQVENHFALVISHSGICLSGRSPTGTHICQKVYPERPGEDMYLEMWGTVSSWLTEHLGFKTNRTTGATIDVFVADEALEPDRLWPEWEETKNLRIKVTHCSVLFGAFKHLSPSRPSNLIADFPHPFDLKLPCQIVSGVLILAALAMAVTGTTALGNQRSRVVSAERQVVSNVGLKQQFEKNREEITRLQNIYGPWVVMTDEGRASILTTLSRTTDRLLPEGAVLREINITENNLCTMVMFMPFSEPKEMTLKATKFLEALRKAHPELAVQQDGVRPDPISSTITVTGEFKFSTQ